MDRDFPFTMLDVVSLLGLPLPANGRTNYNIDCPCCGDTKRHLNINLVKGVFRCPRCGFGGGVLDLYGHYANMSRQDSYAAILHRLSISPEQRNRLASRRPKQPETSACPLTDVDTRDATYRTLLNALPLASDHRDNLVERGLSKEAVRANGYRSTPMLGHKALAKQLLSEGCYLAGVPGFYRCDGQWSLVALKRGILIPVLDVAGRIQGLQIRLDNADRRKFRWLASKDYPDGCGAKGWVHIAGHVAETMLLTEGPMKADVIRFLTGHSVIAVTGVTAQEQLAQTLFQLRERGLRTIMTAFDMDMLQNPNVEQAFHSLRERIALNGFRFGTYVWDPRYKGLDDYALARAQGN